MKADYSKAHSLLTDKASSLAMHKSESYLVMISPSAVLQSVRIGCMYGQHISLKHAIYSLRA